MPKESEGSGPKKFAWYLLTMGMTLAMTAFLLQTFAFFKVSGTSMEPTFRDGDAVVMKRASELRSGQVTVFPMPSSWAFLNPDEEGQTLVKRVWAVPGDKFEFDGKRFTVNGEAVGTLPVYPCPIQRFSVILGPNEAFVVGDNAGISLDSRRILCVGTGNPYVNVDSLKGFGTVQWKSS